jgi:hypothetical protein
MWRRFKLLLPVRVFFWGGGSTNVSGGRGKAAYAVRLYWLVIKKAPLDGTPLIILQLLNP